jgi:hypothetical protein
MDKILEARMRYLAKHKLDIKDYNSQYYQQNKTRIGKARHERYYANLEKSREYQRKKQKYYYAIRIANKNKKIFFSQDIENQNQ